MVALSSKSDEQETSGFDRRVTALISVFAALCFAATFEIGQKAAALFEETVTIFITRFFAFAILLMIMVIKKRRLIPSKTLLPLLLVMGLMDALALFCVLSAGSMPDAKFASVASSIFGLVTILLCWLFLRERLTPIQWLGCCASFAAIAYLGL